MLPTSESIGPIVARRDRVSLGLGIAARRAVQRIRVIAPTIRSIAATLETVAASSSWLVVTYASYRRSSGAEWVSFCALGRVDSA